MNDLEQRLRRDLKDITERVGPESIRPLRVPPVRRRSRAVRWLAPVAAVAAVIGVITGELVAGPSGGKQPRATHHPGPAIAEPTGPMPSYYVTAFQTFGAGNPELATFAAVHDSATGATLAMVQVPTLRGSDGSTQGPSITAAGDDRTFVITESARQAARNANVTKFYLLRVAADGRSARLRLLHVSIHNLMVDDVALSPDGGKLAVAAQRCGSASRCQFTGIRVITLATGAAANWTAQVPGAPWNLSWVGDEYLAFQWQAGQAGQSYRLLDVAGTGGNVLAAPEIASPAALPDDYGFIPRGLVTADGKAMVTTAISDIPEGNGRDTVIAKIIELSARTGQLLKVLYTVTARHVVTRNDNALILDQSCRVLSLGPTGVQPLVSCFTFGRVENGKLTSLPGFPSPSSSGISGQQAGAW